MKKIISVISAIAIASSMFIPSVYAENADDTMKTVLEGVKERVEIPAEYTEFESKTHTQYGITGYDFTWRNEQGNKYINVSCFEDGIISSYYGSDLHDYNDKPVIPTISKEEAKKNAEEFAKTLNPDFPYELRIEDNGRGSLYGGGYEFDTEIYVNGIHFAEGNGSVMVNGETGEINRFNAGYIPVEFPSADNAINLEDAKKAYSEKLGLEMIYRTYTDEDGKDIAYPVYVQKYEYDKFINALTGDVEDLSSDYSIFTNSLAGGMREAAADKGLSEQEIKELDNISGLISKTDVETRLRSNKTLDIPKSISVDSINLSKEYKKDVYIYSIIMSDDETYVHISLNAKTGEILSYYRSVEKSDEQKYQNDKTFKTLAADKADEYKYSEENQCYERYVNGIRVEGDNANIVYSGDTLTSYNISYTDTQFPQIGDAMNVSDAEKVMFDKDGYEIEYMQSASDKNITIVPVYKHNTVSINPFTGKYVDYQNEEITDNGKKIEYSDISGHYAEKYINELAYYGVGFEGGEFRPDEKITQKDYLSLLTAVYQSGIIVMRADKEQADFVYRNSIGNNIISEDERNDEAAVTRENAAVYMIRAMGAEDYAKYNDIYVTPFNDVTENKGYVALLSAMGVVSGDENGSFNPQHEITRAESIIMIYNYLTR